MTFDPKLIHQSFALVADNAEKVTGHFYALVFTENPALRDMFPPMMDMQRDRLLGALVQVVHHAHEPHTLVDYLQQLGRDHRKFGVQPEHYETVRRCLIAAMKRFAKPGWTPEMDAAWDAAFDLVASTMITAANEAAKTTPPSWTGRVVKHVKPTSSLALITVEPDQPYPFKPGQYCSIETQRWPRVWRSYSFANAPRPDNLLTFQVRAVDGGWVSNALVHHLNVGDTMRMGPAVGGLLCDSASMRDVLMIGGGTGIAPLLAIVEDMARWNTSRQVSLFYGVRKAEDLYALPMFGALRERCPWLKLIPCVSHEPGYRGEQGVLPDVLTRHGANRGNWNKHDVLVCGSAPMMRATLARLVELNVPSASIRFDAFTEQTDVYLGLKKLEEQQQQQQQHQQPPAARKVLTSDEEPPEPRAPLPSRRSGAPRNQASKSSATSSDVGRDWQASTNPSIFSSGSRA